MTHVATNRGARGKGLRSKAAKRKKQVTFHNTHSPKQDHTPEDNR